MVRKMNTKAIEKRQKKSQSAIEARGSRRRCQAMLYFVVD